MAVRAPISLDDALHRASYFATHEEEVEALKEQYSANKNNVAKKNIASKEPATKGQHSYAITNSPQNKSSTYDPRKHCAFHDRKGHSTEDCRAALRSQSENKKTSEDTEEEEEEPAYQRRAENSIGVREPLSGLDHEITFDENETADLDKPHDDALIIRLEVGGCKLSRVMIDTGSSADVLFYDASKRMGFTKALLKQERTPLIGFARETTYSLGSIELAVTAGKIKKIVEFIVIDRPAPFNAILGRPWLNSMKAVPSTYHQCLKFSDSERNRNH
ncbi:uncharacterized protein LOC106363625 [Brassica napus]|uniref:uncharacterized protein LOC106363625 n=1 Tax=Brassica napus TaxID=3708 RepID=UPI0006AB7139|nr:uncharacterized protein LOC106363625 [Brassica napus]